MQPLFSKLFLGYLYFCLVSQSRVRLMALLVLIDNTILYQTKLNKIPFSGACCNAMISMLISKPIGRAVNCILDVDIITVCLQTSMHKTSHHHELQGLHMYCNQSSSGVPQQDSLKDSIPLQASFEFSFSSRVQLKLFKPQWIEEVDVFVPSQRICAEVNFTNST